MINIENVINYIETTNHIKLYDFQKEILRHIIKGDIVYTPRCAGRSLLVEGYADYMKKYLCQTDYSHGKDGYDAIFTYEDELPSKLITKKQCDELKETSPEIFKREMECKFE